MATINFGGSLPVNPPNYSSGFHPKRPQVSNMTTGGRIITTSMRISAALNDIVLSWVLPGLPVAQYNSLNTYIETTIDRRTTSFTFTWVDATTYTVHYWEGWDSFIPAKPGDRYVGTMILREIPT